MHVQFVEDYIPRNRPSKVRVAGGRYVEPGQLLYQHYVL